MKDKNIPSILGIFKEKVGEIYQDELKQLILFGSQARGEANTDSDIDVLIVIQDKDDVQDENKRQKVIDLVSDLCLKYEVLISCVYVNQFQFDNEKSPLLLNIHKEGIKL